MPKQLSTSVSDFALACSVYYVVFDFYKKGNVFAMVGLFIQGLAASVGVVRYAMLRPEGTSVFHAHKFLSWLAAAAGTSLLAYQFCLKYNSTIMGYLIISFSTVVTSLSQFAGAENKQLYTQAASGLAMLTILSLCSMNANYHGAAATLVYILAGAIIGAEGTIFGILRVDFLHYALVFGNLLFKKSL